MNRMEEIRGRHAEYRLGSSLGRCLFCDEIWPCETAEVMVEYEKVLARNDDLEAIFQLQWTRMGEATKLWQEETGRDDTWPDLGDLLEWLMERRG
jgi:hypothetical protein